MHYQIYTCEELAHDCQHVYKPDLCKVSSSVFKRKQTELFIKEHCCSVKKYTNNAYWFTYVVQIMPHNILEDVTKYVCMCI